MNQKIINVSEANLYRAPNYQSEITTQALMGEIVDVIEEAEKFTHIKLNDTYQDWIDNQQICDIIKLPDKTAKIRSHVVRIHSKPDLQSQTIRDVTIGCNLHISDQEGNWLQVVLPDGIKGWIPKEHFGEFPELNRENILKMAYEFLGYPYFWGGKTPKGLDCSGFVQLVFTLLGKNISRDAWMQYRDAAFISKDYSEAQPGDLFFYGKSEQKIDHVGIALGNGKIVHANGMIRIHSMNPDDDDFSDRLIRKFIAVKTFFK